MTQEDEQQYRNTNISWFCENIINSNKVRNHCHLTGKYRGPVHAKCFINVEEKKNNFIELAFHNFSCYDCHLFFKKVLDMKKDEVKLDIIPKTNEEYKSVANGCFRFFDDYRFLSSGLDRLVKRLNNDNIKLLRKKVSG